MEASGDQSSDDIPWDARARLVLEEGATGLDQSTLTLEAGVRRFWETDWERQSTATLFVDREIALDGKAPSAVFYGDEIDALVRRLMR